MVSQMQSIYIYKANLTAEEIAHLLRVKGLGANNVVIIQHNIQLLPERLTIVFLHQRVSYLSAVRFRRDAVQGFQGSSRSGVDPRGRQRHSQEPGYQEAEGEYEVDSRGETTTTERD